MTLEYQPSEENISIDKNSRYNSTTLFNVEGILFFNTWNKKKYTVTGNEQYYEVKASDAGRIDLVAFNLYGDVSLWWLLAYANGIIDPFVEIPVGTRLLVPLRNEVFNL